jgi:hypothetical protein
MKERPPLRDGPAGPMPALLIPLLGSRYPKSKELTAIITKPRDLGYDAWVTTPGL